MNTRNHPVLSVVVPVYNEAAGIESFHRSLTQALDGTHESYEIIYVDDGSTDASSDVITPWLTNGTSLILLRLTRNFGKEVATTAGIHTARGEAILTLDADGQHPPELIPDFVTKWRQGAQVVIGIRTANRHEGTVKRWGSKLYYGLFSRLAGFQLVAGATDFRLIDRVVQQDFMQLTERNRMTRALIDWLGYERVYIRFEAKAREVGSAGYSFRKLTRLAIDSAISLSISPLYITAYIGAIVLPLATLLGLGMVVNYLLSDPLHLHATGGAYIMVLVLFLIGILLVSQGIIGLYLSHIHTETQNRPLYVIDKERSRGI